MTVAAFVPTHEWQSVPPGAVCPPGLQYDVDLESGVTRARIPPKTKTAAGAPLDAITVLRSAQGKAVNKIVQRCGEDVVKRMAKNDGFFVARTVLLPDEVAMADLLHEVGSNPDTTISLGLFKGAPSGEFMVWPKDALAKVVQVDPADPQAWGGFHEIGGVPAVARKKINMRFGSWLLFDRDRVKGMPPELAELTPDEWLAAMDRLLPGIATARRVVLPSTTNRIVVDGETKGSDSHHLFVQVEDPCEITRVWPQLLPKSFLVPLDPNAPPWEAPAVLGFLRPKHSRTEPDKIVAHQPWSIFDPSTGSPERLVFDGAPIARGGGIEIKPPEARGFAGPKLDLAAFEDLSETAIPVVERLTRTTIQIERGSNGEASRITGVSITSPTLRMDLEVETEKGWTTVAQLLKDEAGHTRIQSPFRDSSSWAAYFNVHADGSPFIYDTGTNTKFVLPDSEDLRGYTDEALTSSLGRAWQHEARHCAAWGGCGKWLFWTGSHWRPDDTLAHINRARGHMRSLAQRSSKKMRAHLESKKTIFNVVSLARANTELTASLDQWDSDQEIMGAPDATIVLTTGSTRAPNPAEHVTMLAGVAPAKPGTPTPLWTAFLKRITAGDVDLQAYLQRVAGYCLTGCVQEHAMFFLYGTGANGKTVFINTLLGIWGAYGITIGTEMLMSSLSDRHPTEIARLRGKRLAVGSEIEANQVWAESKIKKLTGGERLQGRFMRQDFFEFEPQFKLMIAGNNKPSLVGVDEAILRRLHLVPFLVTIPPKERNLHLAEDLRPEWPGIFRWALDGCIEWRCVGLQPPEAVLDATTEYLSSEDTVGQWIDERLTMDPAESCTKLRTGIKTLFGDWHQWAQRGGHQTHTRNWLSSKLTDRGYKKDKDRFGHYFVVGMKPEIPDLHKSGGHPSECV
jgi:putative DNA primase/helicase